MTHVVISWVEVSFCNDYILSQALGKAKKLCTVLNQSLGSQKILLSSVIKGFPVEMTS